MSQVEDAQAPDGGRGAKVKARIRRMPWKTLVFLAVVVAIVLPGVSTIQSGYYQRYPDLGGRMENWRVSTHALMSCADCHIEPGIEGYLSYGIRSIPAFYSQLAQGPSSTNLFSTPSVDACQKCHTGFREVSSSGDLLIPHQAHVEILEIDCALCHQDLVHADNMTGRNTPRMTLCLEECHDGEQASTECIDCHTRKQVPDDHRNENWLDVHSERQEESDCGSCHDWSPVDFCVDCHSELPGSHEGVNWKNEHQYPALERGEDGCMTCHDTEFCQQCHD